MKSDSGAPARRASVPGPLARRIVPSPNDLLIITAFLLSLWKPLVTEDLWWRLRTGAWILQNLDVPHNNIFAFTAAAHDWIDHEWLSNVIFFWCFDQLGPGSLLFLRGAILSATIGLLYRLLRRRGGVIPSCLLAAWSMTVMLVDLRFSPLLFSGLLLMIMLTLLEDRDWRQGKSLILLPVLFFLWANLHGTFLIGLVLLVAHTFGGMRDLLRRRGDASTPGHLGAAGLAVLFTLWNPYYGQLYSLGFEDLWQLLGSAPLRLQMLPWLYLLCAGLVLLGTWLIVAAAGREVRWRLAFPLLLLTPVALLVPSYSALWALWGAVTNMEHLQQLAERIRHERRGYLEEVGGVSRLLRRVADRFAGYSTYDRFLARGTYSSLVLTIMVAYFSVPPGSTVAVAGTTWTGLTLEDLMPEDRVPEQGIDALFSAAFPGARVMAPAGWGSYLEWIGSPDLLVFMDGRESAYPLDVVDDYDRFADARPAWEEVLERYQVDYLMWPSTDFQPRALMATGEWVVLHSDQACTVLAHVGGPDEQALEARSPQSGAVRRRVPEQPGQAPMVEPTLAPESQFGLFRPNRSGPQTSH